MGGNELEVLNHYNKKILKYKEQAETIAFSLFVDPCWTFFKVGGEGY